MAIHKFTRLIDLNEKIPMYGDGSSRRDYTYIDDIVDGIWRVLQYHKGYDVYNLGESQTTSLKELIQFIEGALKKKAIIEPLPLQPGDVSITYADITKAEQTLRYRPNVKMEEGINRFVEWYQAEKLK